jgi:acylphosphatase
MTLHSTRYHVFVSGLVQGVGFREFSRREAARLQLLGWAKNLSDGRVEIVAEGEPAALDRFLERLRLGPPAARVRELSSSEEPSTGEFREFGIRR